MQNHFFRPLAILLLTVSIAASFFLGAEWQRTRKAPLTAEGDQVILRQATTSIQSEVLNDKEPRNQEGGDEGFLSSLFKERNIVKAQEPSVDLSPLFRAWEIVDEKYNFPDKPTDEEKLWGAIKGVVESIGDPYSTFLPPRESKIFQGDIAGNFGGVGIEIGMRNGVLTVISPLKDTPAYHAGLEAGDLIIKIDGEPTTNMTLEDAVIKIRGEIGTPVTLTVWRDDGSSNGQTFDVEITRSRITIPVLDTKIVDDVFVISLYNFNAESSREFRNAIKEYITSKKNYLILDLRNNPGGYLDAAIDIASYFVPKGEVIVKEDLGIGEEQRIHRSLGYAAFPPSRIPRTVVLINEGSASASEIVAAALREHGIATLVGTKTFGKGSVQELVPLTSNSLIKITVAKWLTPLGNSISEGGVAPDYEIPITRDDLEQGRDPQMEKALEILQGKPGL